MAGGHITLTREGRDKICEELEVLKGEKRREIAKALAEARAHGDLSENAEYDAAKEAQAMNEKRIAELEDTLAIAAQYDIYAYDAYLIRCGLKFNAPLLSLDRGLLQAAGQAGIQVIEVT